MTTRDGDGFVSTAIAVDGSTRPTTGTSIRVRVDRFLDPSSATRQAICVQSSTANITGIEGCSAGLVLRPSYDPTSRTVTYYLETETTKLAPDTLYRITLFRSEGEDGFGLRAFDGPPLGGPFVLEFTTEALNPQDPGPTEGPRLDINFCSSRKCEVVCDTRYPRLDDAAPDYDAELDAANELSRDACKETCAPGIEDVLGSCAYGGCHQATDLKPKVPMGLDLFAPEGLQATAIAHVAHGTERGPGAQNPDAAGVAFGRAMPIIAPGDAGNSYLLYKVVANPAFDPDDTTVAVDERLRLRQAFVVGAPMPPTFAGTAEQPASNGPLTPEMARRLSDWIAAGADTNRCEPPLP